MNLKFASISIVALATVGASFAATFNKGDVFAAVSNGMVQHYDKNLNLIEVLNTGLGGYTTGMCFDKNGNLYVTDFSTSQVSTFDKATGSLTGTFGGGYSIPESVLFDKSGNFYSSSVGGLGIQKFDSAGNYLTSYVGGRTDWIDLGADQTTMYFTGEGNEIVIRDLPSDTETGHITLPGTGAAYALRLVGNSQVLVAQSNQIDLMNLDGTVAQIYTVPNENSFFALNLDPNGTSFWSGDFGTGDFFKFNIASGAIEAQTNTGTGNYTLFGLAVEGELTKGGPPPTAPAPAALLSFLLPLLRRRKKA